MCRPARCIPEQACQQADSVDGGVGFSYFLGSPQDSSSQQNVLDNYEKVLEALHRQTQADIEKNDQLRRQNDLAEQALAELQRNRQAQQQRMRLAFDTNDKLTGLLPMLLKAFQDIQAINYRLAEAERRAERTDDILLLLQTEKSPQKVEEARIDLEAEMTTRQGSQRKQLRTHIHNLARLREQAAYHGTQIPTGLMNEIEAEEQAIQRVKGILKEMLENPGDE